MYINATNDKNKPSKACVIKSNIASFPFLEATLKR